MTRIVSAALAVTIAIASIPWSSAQEPGQQKANGADWPAFRGPSADGIASDCRISLDWVANPPQEVWRFRLSAKPWGLSGLSVANGQVFIIDHDGDKSIIRAISFADGRQQWESPIDDPDGNRCHYGFDRATPTVDNGKVFCLARCGQLDCLDTKTGARTWSVDLVKDYGAIRPEHYFSASPVVDGNALLLMSGPKVDCLLILDKRSGRKLGQAGGPNEMPEKEMQVSLSTPVIATIGGVKQYVVCSDSRFMGIDAATLKVLWHGQYPTPDYCSQPLMLGDAVFYETGDSGEFSVMADIIGDKIQKKWNNKEIGGGVGGISGVHNFFPPIFSQGFIYGSNKNGNVLCLDAKTGEVKWKSTGNPKRCMQVVGVEGALMVLNWESGEVSLVKLSPDACTVLGSVKPFTAKGEFYYYAPLVVARHHLLVRGPNDIVCFALK
jgi:outer membrane protein assembly factor BamB